MLDDPAIHSTIQPATDSDTQTDDRLYCAACGAEATRTRWAVTVQGKGERAVANPAGVFFLIVPFIEAPGTGPLGDATTAHSWYDGYAWTIALCRACNIHLGWRFDATADAAPSRFYGLIKDRLTGTQKK